MESSINLPPLHELLERVRIVSIPTRTRFRGVSVREAAVFDAPNRASEFSPFLEYEAQEASSWLAAAIEYGWGALPAMRRERIQINATVPAVSADQVPSVLARFDGCTTAKVKVAERGQTIEDDVARLRAVREVMGDDALVRVDANGGWNVAESVAGLRALAQFDLDYAEQPCMSVPGLIEVREQLDGLVRIAADESVRKASDPLAVAKSGAADLLIIKAQPLGGLTRALEIIDAAGLPVVVSSALDTSIGIGMGLHLAAALPDGVLAGACGLGTVALLEGDVAAAPLIAEHGSIAARSAILDSGQLDRYQAAPDRTTWWHERISACYRVLEEQGAA